MGASLHLTKLLLLLSCVLLVTLHWPHSSPLAVSLKILDELKGWDEELKEQEMIFALAICKGHHQTAGDQMKHSDRQMKQTRVLLKSAAALTSVKLRFIIVADSEELFNQTRAFVNDWPEEYRRKMTLQYVPLWYPTDHIEMKNVFRPCATQRIFLPTLLPEEKALIYLDTDILFMTPPEDVWAQFSEFNSRQVVAIPPILRSLPQLRVPYFNLTGQTGLNSGVIFMNLTRMRTFPDAGWVGESLKIYDEYKDRIMYGDQDIINLLFIKYPDLVFISNCEWDYQTDFCRDGIHHCPEAEEYGARLVHGNTGAFVLDHQWKMRALFESWDKFKLGSSLVDLYYTIEASLHRVVNENLESECSKIPEIDVVLSQQLLTHIRKNSIC